MGIYDFQEMRQREEKHSFACFLWDSAKKPAWRRRHFKTVHLQTINTGATSTEALSH